MYNKFIEIFIKNTTENFLKSSIKWPEVHNVQIILISPISHFIFFPKTIADWTLPELYDTWSWNPDDDENVLTDKVQWGGSVAVGV